MKIKRTFFLIGLLAIFAGFLWQIGLNLQNYKIGTYLYNDSVILENPMPEDEIESPLSIKGKARGTWFFEGDFPVVLTDWDGRIIAEGYATAQSDWMTEDFVNFEGILEFEKPVGIETFNNRGFLILQKDNPSDLPENDDALEITVYFK